MLIVYEKLIFNSKNEYFFHHQVSKKDKIKVLRSIPFKNIIGIQKIRYDQAGEKFYNFEVPLVLNDYSRINLFATQQSDDIDLKSSFISISLIEKLTINILKKG